MRMYVHTCGGPTSHTKEVQWYQREGDVSTINVIQPFSRVYVRRSIGPFTMRRRRTCVASFFCQTMINIAAAWRRDIHIFVVWDLPLCWLPKSHCLSVVLVQL